jgi:hypothetical protein
MAVAKKKKSAKPSGPHELITLHRDITAKVRAMMARCEGLRDAGKMDEARRLLVKIERLMKELKDLER